MPSHSNVKGIGIDIVEISRIEKALNRRRHFAERLFTPGEIDYCLNRNCPAKHFAVRFAAKEAVAKALGTGFRGGVSWREIEVLRDGYGRPMVELSGQTAKVAALKGHDLILLSVSFDRERAIAVAISA